MVDTSATALNVIVDRKYDYLTATVVTDKKLEYMWPYIRQDNGIPIEIRKQHTAYGVRSGNDSHGAAIDAVLNDVTRNRDRDRVAVSRYSSGYVFGVYVG